MSRSFDLVSAELKDAMQDQSTAMREYAAILVKRADSLEALIRLVDLNNHDRTGLPKFEETIALAQEMSLSMMRVRECEQRCERLLMEFSMRIAGGRH